MCADMVWALPSFPTANPFLPSAPKRSSNSWTKRHTCGSNRHPFGHRECRYFALLSPCQGYSGATSRPCERNWDFVASLNS